MADTFNVGSSERVFVNADEDNRVRVTVHGSTVYYGDQTVSASSNDGSITDGDNETLSQAKYFISAGSSQLVVEEAVEVEEQPPVVTEDYAGADSYQPIAADLNLAAAAGTSTSGDSSFLAAIMGNVIGSALSKTKNYIAGVIGHYTVESTNASTYPSGAVLAGIGDGTTTADGAVISYIDGDSATTTAGAAFKVMSNNSTAASGFDFALDCQDAAHDGYQAVDADFYNKAPIRLVTDVCLLVFAGAPVDGTSGTGAGNAGKGSLLVDSTNGKLYINTNTKASPTWTVAGSQS